MLPPKQFIVRLAHSGIIALTLAAVSLLIGMTGYHVLERLSWIDAFLNASMLMGGMGPVHTPITHGGKKGTYSVMADGSVKFIDATISDDVLKAMATVYGPAGVAEDEKVIAVPDPTQRIEPKAAPKIAQPKTDPKKEAAPDEKKK